MKFQVGYQENRALIELLLRNSGKVSEVYFPWGDFTTGRWGFNLTDAELPPDDPVKPHLCDHCGECVKACPGHARGRENHLRSSTRSIRIRRSDMRRCRACAAAPAMCIWRRKASSNGNSNPRSANVRSGPCRWNNGQNNS